VWTDADRRAVLDGRAAGLTYRELGARFGGMSVERMRQVVRKSERLRAAGRLPKRLHRATVVDSDSHAPPHSHVSRNTDATFSPNDTPRLDSILEER
jgi:hypothetical protein